MAEFALPKNSKIRRGKAYAAAGGKRAKSFKVYRYDPDSKANPRYDTYSI
ncbi:MAG TPA: succinate dehydrogenase iron-sulfur subunit, partial [Sphingomicrobium sp.]|nr:succinate dehydrogenase iron-sulfur subunit [Sphingomicrobium sp.]